MASTTSLASRYAADADPPYCGFAVADSFKQAGPIPDFCAALSLKITTYTVVVK